MLFSVVPCSVQPRDRQLVVKLMQVLLEELSGESGTAESQLDSQHHHHHQQQQQNLGVNNLQSPPQQQQQQQEQQEQMVAFLAAATGEEGVGCVSE
jgi:hypothetical protein